MNKLMHAWDQAGGDEAGNIEHSRSQALGRCYRQSSTGLEISYMQYDGGPRPTGLEVFYFQRIRNIYGIEHRNS